MKKRRSRARSRAAASAGGLMLAPMVALMRLPLLAAEAGKSGKLARETALALNEKVEAASEGMFAAQSSMLGSLMQFWPDVLAGRTPAVLSGAAVRRSMDAALAPASRRVAANYRRLSKP